MKPGDKFDRYRIDDVLGAGGMGRVFRAYDERLDRHVAIKVLLNDEAGEDSRGRLIREARAAAKLSHPNVVGVFDVGEHEGNPYVAMELIEGKSLRALIDDGTTTPETKLRIMLDVARALSAAHDAQIVHRDVKPENVIVQPDGRVKVLDFGIARRTHMKADPSSPTEVSLATLTADGVKLGTPTYMAPEQIKGGAIDGRVDQFAWAITAYELFVGRPPWGGDAMAVIAAIIGDEPAPPPAEAEMPLPFSGVVRKALSKPANDRFTSMKEIVAELERQVGDSVRTPSSGQRRPRSQPPVASLASPGSNPPGMPRAGVYDVQPTSHPVSVAPAGPRPMMLSRRYGGIEMANMLDRALAVQRKPLDAGQITDAAREFGVDEPSLHFAMTELTRRGVIDEYEAEKKERMARVKRLGAVFGLIATFFVLLNLAHWDHDGFYMATPIISVGLGFGLLMVRHLFPSPKKRSLELSRDQAFEYDVQQIARLFESRTRIADPQLRQVRIAEAEQKVRIDPRAMNTLEQAEAELDEYLAAPAQKKSDRD